MAGLVPAIHVLATRPDSRAGFKPRRRSYQHAVAFPGRGAAQSGAPL